ncbi:MAG: glycine cleavage T C-terminal barrel domain-containing protein [Acidimicrobiia bacterium]
MTGAATTWRGGADSYGDVTGEYLALRTGAGAVAGWHDLVWVRGPDAVPFLDGLLSQAVEPMAPGRAARSLLLSPQGKLRAPHLLLRGVDEVGLLTDAGRGVIVEEDLRRFKIRVDVAIEPEPGPVVAVWGLAATGVVEKMVGVVADGWERRGDVVVASVPFARVPLPRLALVGVGIDPLIAAGAVRCGRLAADAVRIEAGEPLMGVDIDEKTIAQEADLVDGAVVFTKGCYLGQELIARIDSRGHVNRRLRGVRLTINVLPPVGAEVVWGEEPVGAITSIAESLTLSAPVGMAMVRRQVEPGSPVMVRWAGGEAPAVVETLPLDPTLGT